MAKLKDMTGRTIHRLTILSRAPNRNGQAWWLCRCVCGKTLEVFGRSLRDGDAKSCGCLSRDRTIARSTTHGHAGRNRQTSEYRIWQGMVKRCEDPRCVAFPNYGGRGIKVAPELRTFEGFLAHMGPRPVGLTLERINNNGNYEPGNVCWATRKAQGRNSRHNHILTFRGMAQPISAWTEMLGFKRTTIGQRLRYGWSTERALSTPLGASIG